MERQTKRLDRLTAGLDGGSFLRRVALAPNLGATQTLDGDELAFAAGANLVPLACGGMAGAAHNFRRKYNSCPA